MHTGYIPQLNHFNGHFPSEPGLALVFFLQLLSYYRREPLEISGLGFWANRYK